MALDPVVVLGAGVPITRFIHSQRDFNRERMLVKPDAFMPDHNRETSIAVTAEHPESDIWAMARHTLRDKDGRRQVHARADLAAAVAIGRALRCIQDDIGFVGHGEILDWPADKATQKEIALDLCAAATLVLATPPVSL